MAFLHRTQLLTLARGRDPAPFITVAGTWLRSEPDDQIRLVLARRLAECGLLARAADVLAELSPALRETPAVAQMMQELRSAPGGRTTWARFQSHFDDNLAALADRCGWTDAVRAAWSQQREHFELHCDADGVWQVWDRERQVWCGGFGRRDPEAALPGVAQKMRGNVLQPFVLQGVGLGEPVEWLVNATADTLHGASTVVYVVEPSYAALAACLHLRDWTTLLRDPRLRLFAGPNAVAEFELAGGQERRAGAPGIVLCTPYTNDPGTPLQAVNTRIARTIEQRATVWRDRAQQRYAERDSEYWAGRYADALSGRGAPLRVLACTSRFTTVLQYSTRDALQGFEAAGCQTRLLIEEENWARIPPEIKLEAIEEFEPDLVFMIDHLRAGHRAGLVPNLPVLTWVQDRLPWLFDPSAGRGLGPLDFCMGFSAVELTLHFGYPLERFFPCEMATNPSALGEPGCDDGPLAERFACDLAYASHQSKSPEETWREVRDGQPAEFHPLIDAIREELFSLSAAGRLNGNYDCDALAERLMQATGVMLTGANRARLVDLLIRPLADRLLRFETIGWAADWAEATGGRFNLYGKGWEDHPRFGRYARGVLAHGRELGAAFRAAKVSLHTGCNPAFHQRVLDGLAAGGFFLVRRHAGDFNWQVQKAILDLGQERGLQPPFDVRPSDLRPPHSAHYAALLESNGICGGRPGRMTTECWRGLQMRFATDGPYDAAHLWPDLTECVFGSGAEFFDRMASFAGNNPRRRATIAAAMRTRVMDRFTYEALTRAVLHWVARQLAEQSRRTTRHAVAV